MKTFEEFRFRVKHSAITEKHIDDAKEFKNLLDKFNVENIFVCTLYNGKYYPFYISEFDSDYDGIIMGPYIKGPNNTENDESYTSIKDYKFIYKSAGWSVEKVIFRIKQYSYNCKFFAKMSQTKNPVYISDIYLEDDIVVIKFEDKQ